MSYPLILQRCLNTPLLIEEAKLQILTSEVFLKLLANEPIDRSKSTPKNEQVSSPPQIAVIPVYGSLVNKNGVGASGVTSYENIRNSIYDVVNSDIKTVGFDFSTGGGEASGNFPLADLIYSLPKKYGITTFGFTDSIAASGGYSLLAATQHVFATDMATVGSIGAVATLADVTKMDEKLGVAYEIIRSRSSKQAYNPHEGITDKARKQVLEGIMAWDKKFFVSMQKYRPQLTEKILTDLDGGVVTAEEGLELGLVDTIVSSIEDVFPLMMEKNSSNVSRKQGIITMATQEETLTKLMDAQAEIASLKSSLDLEVKKAVKIERDRCLKILEAQNTFGVSASTAINAISKEFSVEMVTEMFTEIKAQMDAATHINTNTANQASVTPAMIQELRNKGVASFDADVEAGLKELGNQPQLFAGVR